MTFKFIRAKIREHIVRHAATILLCIAVGLLTNIVNGYRQDIRGLQDRVLWLETWQAESDRQLEIFPPPEKSA